MGPVSGAGGGTGNVQSYALNGGAGGGDAGGGGLAQGGGYAIDIPTPGAQSQLAGVGDSGGGGSSGGGFNATA